MDRRIRTSMYATLVLAIVGCTSFAGQTGQTPVTSEQLLPGYQQDERTFLTDQDKKLEAQQSRQALLRKAQETHRMLQELAERAASFSHRMNTLLDSDVGKRIARYHVGPLLYVSLSDFPAAPVPEVTAKLDTASALLNRLNAIPNNFDVGFALSEKTQQELQDLHAWAIDRQALLKTAESSLNTLIRDAPADIDLSKSKTLRVAIEEFRSLWPNLAARYKYTAQRLAAQDVNDTLMQGAYQAQIERAMFERDTIIAQMRAEIDRLRQEFQVALLEQQQENERALAQAHERYKNTLAELDRLRQQGKVDREVAAANDKLHQSTQLEAVRKEQLKAMARSQEVQRLLAPFLATGYHQPGQAVPAYEKGPVSLSKLQAMHALRPSTPGLRALLAAGTAVRDKERPRWSFPKTLQQLNSQELDQLKQAQQYLIDLGDIMVELGMLAP